MADGFVSASEVAYVVSEYLRQEGFEQSLGAFRAEAAVSLGSVTAVRKTHAPHSVRPSPPPPAGLTLAPVLLPQARPGRSLCSILSEYVRLKRAQAAREETVRAAASRGDGATDSVAERTLRSVLSLLDDYKAVQQPQLQAAQPVQPQLQPRALPTQQPQPLPPAQRTAAAPAAAPAVHAAVPTPAARGAHGGGGASRRASQPPAHQSPSKKRKSYHPRRTVVSATVAPPRGIQHGGGGARRDISSLGGPDAALQPLGVSAGGTTASGGTAVPTAAGIVAAQIGSPARLSAIEDETFEQLLTNDGVHTALAEVLTTRLQAAGGGGGGGMGGGHAGAAAAAAAGLPNGEGAWSRGSSAGPGAAGMGSGQWGAAAESASSSAGAERETMALPLPLPPSLAVEDVLRDCAANAAAADGGGGTAAHAADGSGSGSGSGGGWQPQKVFNAILALEPTDRGGRGERSAPSAAGQAPSQSGAAAITTAPVSLAAVGTSPISSAGQGHQHQQQQHTPAGVGAAVGSPTATTPTATATAAAGAAAGMGAGSAGSAGSGAPTSGTAVDACASGGSGTGGSSGGSGERPKTKEAIAPVAAAAASASAGGGLKRRGPVDLKSLLSRLDYS